MKLFNECVIDIPVGGGGGILQKQYLESKWLRIICNRQKHQIANSRNTIDPKLDRYIQIKSH